MRGRRGRGRRLLVGHLPTVLLASLLLSTVLSGCLGSRASRHGVIDHDPIRPNERGVLHTVQKGQTLWRIARTYDVSLQELAEINDIQDPTKIRVGQALWIPGATRVLDVEVVSTPAPRPPRGKASSTVATRGSPPSRTSTNNRASANSGSSSRSSSGRDAKSVTTAKNRFIWPVNGVLYSRFGVRDGVRHDGIDIAAPEGSPVMAADDGEVIFSGVQRGYGNLILILHSDGLVTIYAHNQRNLVKAGARVRRGERIATVGKSGTATGPHVHFEVRENRIPRNPLFFLP